MRTAGTSLGSLTSELERLHHLQRCIKNMTGEEVVTVTLNCRIGTS